MMSTVTLPLLTTAEYKEIYKVVCDRYHGLEDARTCISKCLSQIVLEKQGNLRVLIIGPGSGVEELKLLSSYNIDHLTAVEPSLEMADELEVNLRTSSNFIKEWKIQRTNIESYLTNNSYSNDSFDIILMIHSIYYISSRDYVLRKVSSLLRPHTGRFIAVITIGVFTEITNKYIPSSSHIYNADDLEHDLRSVNVPFERYLTDVSYDLTGVKEDDKLRWTYASFFLAVNVAYAKDNLEAEVIQDLINMANTTNDGKLTLNFREDIFNIRRPD